MPSPPARTRSATPTVTPVTQGARARITRGDIVAEAEVAITPAGLLAAGGAVAMILLAVAPIILSAAVARRARRPSREAVQQGEG